MTMTKKHFERIAEIINKWSFDVKNNPIKLNEDEIITRLVKPLTDYLGEVNPLFNTQKFLKACGVEK